MPTSKPPLSKLLFASALTLAIHSTLHAASDIESGPNGSSQDVSASVTSSDPVNTISAFGASGAPDANGGNATASATLTPTSNSNSTLTAIGGPSGFNIVSTLPTFGGNANASAFINASANVTLTLTATGGDGQEFPNKNLPYGIGGNAYASASINTTGNISLKLTSQGGEGGGSDAAPPNLEGVGGTASIGLISAISTSGNISLTATQIGGDGDNFQASIGVPYGIGADSSLSNAFSASTTGNITLTQNANAGAGRLPGNANSSLTFSNFSAASITATANANSNTTVPFTSTNTGISPSYGAATAYANLSGTANVLAKAIATSMNDAAPASATAIAHAGPYPANPALSPSFVNAIATAGSNVSSSAYAASYTSNPYFSSVHVYGSTNLPQTEIEAGFLLPISSLTQPAIDATMPLTAPITPTNNPNNTPLLDALIRYLSSSNQTQSFDAGFQGTLNTDLLPAEDLVIKLTPIHYFFNSLQLTILVDQNTQVSISYTNQTFGLVNKPIYFDLGPMQSFGTEPLDLQLDLNATLPSVGGQLLEATVDAYDMNPALLTPEPASLSLLTLATLPLLLKRRRTRIA